MANYYCSCRTNYFKVKDPEAFKEAMLRFSVLVCEKDTLFCLLGEDPDGAGWPCYDEDTWEDFDFFAYVADFLADNSVAIFIEAGAEKLRYIHGSAHAINNKKECEHINLNAIYKKAKSLVPTGTDITHAEY